MYATSDMKGHISSTTIYLNELAHDEVLNLTTPPDLFVEDKQIENPTCEGRLIYPEGCVSPLNKSKLNPIHENAPGNIICAVAAIMSRGRTVSSLTLSRFGNNFKSAIF